jgi:DNA-binding NarL/FixJ family response regulator
MMSVRVLVVDPQPFFSESLARALEEDDRLEVVGWTADPGEARRLVSTLGPDVVLCDLALATPATLGLLDRSDDEPKLIVLTRGHEGDALLPVAAAGAAGCIGHDIGVGDLCALIADAGAGRFVVNPMRLGAALRRAASGPPPDRRTAGDVTNLTLREREILDLLSDGLDNGAIAARLHLSAHTVRTHVANILRKLGVSSRAEAARIALRAGAGDPEVSVLRIEGPKLGER